MAIPWMICFWNMRNTMMAGTEAITLAVMGSVNSERFAPWNWGIPTGRVIIFSDVMDKKGQRKLFQDVYKRQPTQ